MRDWPEILVGTPAQPARQFYEFIFEYTGNYDRINAGLPSGYTRPNDAYALAHRGTWISEAQAEVMETALLDMKRAIPFAYRVFFKHFFSSMPLKQIFSSSKLRLEFKELYAWDGTLEELEYQLRRSTAFLFRKLEELTANDNA